MRNRTHEALGATATLGVCAAADCGALVAIGAIGASLLGSRLPDIDQLGSRIHRRTRVEHRSVMAGLIGRVLRVPITAFAAMAEHRGATHWLLSGAAVTLIFTAVAGAMWPPIALPVAVGMACGYLAHLLADACTPHGAPLLGPVLVRPVHLLPSGHRLRTGGLGDSLILLTAMLAAVALGLVVLQSA